MAQGIKILANQTDDLHFIPGTHTVERNLVSDLYTWAVAGACEYTHTHTPINK